MIYYIFIVPLEVLLKAHKLLFVNIWISCSNFCVPTLLHKLDHLLLFLSLYSSCKIILYKGIFVILFLTRYKTQNTKTLFKA